MALPSFDRKWQDGKRTKPRVSVLEVRDRDKPKNDPILWLFLERQESYKMDQKDGSVWHATIRLLYEAVVPTYPYYPRGKGSFFGHYSRDFGGEPSVSLISTSCSGGAVSLDLSDFEGHRIGTYLMNEIVLWAQQWPEATVCSVKLLHGGSYPENKARRNRFYEQFGLVFDYSDPEQCAGLSQSMPVASLTPVDTWRQNIQEQDVRECFAKILSEREKMVSKLSQYERSIKELSQEIKDAEAHPVRWVLQRLWHKITLLLG